MSVRSAAVHHQLPRRNTRHSALLAGVSALALLAYAVPVEARPLGYGAGGSTPSAAAIAAAQTASQEAARVAQSAQNALKRATLAVQAQQATQQMARDAARAALSTVTDGLSAGGLVVDPRVAAGDTSLWQNISQPSQTTSGGQTTVTLTQGAQRAIATWAQFNVGKNTTLYFDQSGGNSANGNSWTVLNRIDASGVPSQIQGQIKAEGTVLLINPNGIIFNGSSQINVHTLIASSMDINSYATAGAANVGVFNSSGSYAQISVGGVLQTLSGNALLAPSNEANGNTAFLNGGLFVNGASTTAPGTLVLSAGNAGPNAGVKVEAGAIISTVSNVSGFDNGGYVALVGPQVSNAGSITTSAGQIILAAGSSVPLTEPTPGSGATSLSVGGIANLVYWPAAVPNGAGVVNAASGILTSKRGNITLAGDTVEQLGYAGATTSITRAGSITISALGNTIFGPGSITAILPEENGETIPSDASSLASFVAPSIAITTSNMDMAPGSLILAPGANMTVASMATLLNNGSPAGRVLLEAGSEINLAGLTGVTRSVSDYLYTFKVTANDVADTPLAKSLIGQTVTIDLSLTGTRADGETWVGSPLFASSGAGYLSNVTQNINQLLTKGGSLSFGATAFSDVITAPGSVINVSGGWIAYTGATISTSRVIGADSRSYNIGSADPFMAYAGVDHGFTRANAHWGISQSWTSPLRKSSYYKAGYIDGVSAGGLGVTAVTPVLEGDLVADIVIGTQQRALAQTGTGTGGAQATPDQLPTGGALSITLKAGNAVSAPGKVALAADAADLIGADFTLATPLSLPGGVLTYSTAKLSAENLGSITIKGASDLTVAEGASLSVRDGGKITLTGVSTIGGTLTAHAGSIALTGFVHDNPDAQPSVAALTIGAHALLDVSGLWINDSGIDGQPYRGSAFINAGSVSISTEKVSQLVGQAPSSSGSGSDLTARDTTQSIVLSAGSVIDLSSGGYVGANGKLKTGANGLPAGNGGSLSLLTYMTNGSSYGDWASNKNQELWNGNNVAPVAANAASVTLAGTIYAGGLNQGGTLTLQAPAVTIDGAASGAITDTATGMVTLPTGFFTQGFSTYKLTSTYGSTTVAAGTTLRLTQRNYLLTDTALPATGAHLRDVASLGYALDGLRAPVNLTLGQSAFYFGSGGDPSTTAGIVIGEGASILAEPKAAITATADGAITVLGAIVAPGGSISLTGNTPTGGNATLYTAAHDIWIGADAVLDVSGVYVADPRATTYATGSVLDGGSIALSSLGPVVALNGSAFNLKGTSATIQAPASGTGLGFSLADRQIWSNGGTLTLSAGSLYFDGAINAAGGAPQAAGGTLNVSVAQVFNGTAYVQNPIVIAQSGLVASALAGATPPATASALTTLLSGVPGGAFITADTINAAGLDSVALTSTTLAFAGDVGLNVRGALYLNGNVTLLPAGATGLAAATPSVTSTVNLDAGYIRWLGTGAVPAAGSGTLNLNATAQIDLAGIVSASYANTVNLSVSDGDIRFLPLSAVSVSGLNLSGINYGVGGNAILTSTTGVMPAAGALIVPGDLTMTAREIYPATNTAFLVMSLGASGTITFKSNGQSTYTPYSAGGAILVDAKTIVQAGALFAPLGTIQLGYSASQSLPAFLIGSAADTGSNSYDPVSMTRVSGTDPIVLTGTLNAILAGLVARTGTSDATVTTDSVTLASGSVTSTSANGVYVPYGATTDGETWTVGYELTAPPSKLIVLAGNAVTTQAGAVIDERGGGDVYATEFVPGTGGSRNVLATSNTYALVPSYQAKVAAYDTASGGTVALGTAVTLAGGNGIAAGTYVLMPAQYATMPGAYRVVVTKTDTGSTVALNTATTDGSIYMTGTLGSAITGARSSATALLQIQPNATWTRYSQIDITRGDNYFASRATTNGITVPRLARDGGQLVIAAANALTLNAANLFAPADGGRGGQVDITGSNMLVVASDLKSSFASNAAYSNYLILDADQLSGLGVESLLIGGTRTTTSGGTLINATAQNLEIATDDAHALTGADLLMVSLAPASADPNARGIVVDSGSVIAANGTVASGSDTLLIGKAGGAAGDGALLRVSAGAPVAILRSNVAASPLGSLTVASGAVIRGNSLTLDTSGTSNLAGDAVLAAKNYDLSGSVVSLGNVPGATAGLTVSQQLLANLAGADTVRLRSASVFNLYGSSIVGSADAPIGTLTFDGAGLYSDGGTTTIRASNVAFVNSQASVNSTGGIAGAGGHLVVDATDTVSFGAGAKTLNGFAQADVTAGAQVLFTGSGSLDANAAGVTLTAPAVIAAGASTQGLTTTGLLTIAQGAGAAPVLSLADIGGAVTFTAGSILDTGTILAQAGKVVLKATTGDVTLAGNALIDAAGARIALGDLTQDVPAGAITLIADNGNVALGAGTVVDVSAAGNGYAGTLGIQATNGTATLAGTLKGGAAYNDLGGNFVLAANSLGGGLPISAGFTGSFQVSLAQGDIVIAEGQTLTSNRVLLVAEAGSITVNGTIDASGQSAGSIALYATGTTTDAAGTPNATGVTLGATARLLARWQADDPSDPAYSKTANQDGGTITLGTSGTPDGTYDPTFGYQNVPRSGAITVASGAILDVSGGASGTGGAVIVRAPILTDKTVNVSFNGTVVTNADAHGSASGRGLVLDAYATWSTTDLTTGDKHFDGIVDPAGWFNSAGVLQGGGFTNAAGSTVATWNGTSFALASGALTSAGTGSTSSSTTTTVTYGWDGSAFTTTTVTTVYAKNLYTVTTVTVTQTATATTTTTQVGTRQLSTNPLNIISTTTSTATSDLASYNDTVKGYLLAYYYFAPTTANAAHQKFYGYTNGAEANGAGTLMGFVQNPFGGNDAAIAASFAGAKLQIGNAPATALPSSMLHLTPEIVLANPSESINNGDIKVLTNWNLGAATTDPNTGTIMPVYRYNGEAPTLVLRALGNVTVNASITDGFAAKAMTSVAPGSINYSTDFASYGASYAAWALSAIDTGGLSFDSLAVLQSPSAPSVLGYSGPDAYDGYYALYKNYLLTYHDFYYDYNLVFNSGYFLPAISGGETAPLSVTSLLPSVSNYTNYSDYLDAYKAYAAAYNLWSGLTSPATLPVAPSPPPSQSVAVAVTYATPMANTPAPKPSSAESSPVASANLMSWKSSTSYRIAAGVDFLSANPTAVVAGGSADVTISGHSSYANSQYTNGSTLQQTISIGNVVRTGTGSITIAAAGDFMLADAVAPGAVYTAGYAVDTPSDFAAPAVPSGYTSNPNGLVSTPVWGQGGGSVTVDVGGDIAGIEDAKRYGASTWASWYYHAMIANGAGSNQFLTGSRSGNTLVQQTAAWVNYATFADGIGALGGGDVTLRAGGTVRDIIVSLPETLLVSGANGSSSDTAGTLHTYGGGNLAVTAGNLTGSAFLVGAGAGALRVDGAVAKDASGNALELAVQNGTIDVIARGDVTLGGLYDPAMLANQSGLSGTGTTPLAALPGFQSVVYSSLGDTSQGYFTSYSQDSGVSLTSIAGNVTLVTASPGNALMPLALEGSSYSTILAPASFAIAAISGDIATSGSYTSATGANISLIPSASGTLSLVAGGSINLFNTTSGTGFTNYTVTMLDGTSAYVVDALGTPELAALSTALHGNDDGSVTIYAGQDVYGAYRLIKQAKVYAGRDIVNVGFTGQNNRAGDITSIVAGRDILGRAIGYNSSGTASGGGTSFVLYGPGDFVVEAGRNLGPFALGSGGGIFAVGDGSNCGADLCGNVVKPYLPIVGANITTLFGVGGGMDVAAAIAAYVDPAAAKSGGIDYLPDIAKQLGVGEGDAWAAFQALPETKQKLVLERAFLAFLTQVNADYNNAASPYHGQYARAYQAIATLFPAARGYTDNSGGSGALPVRQHTGDLRMARSLIETQTGGDINIIGPGGNAYVGSNSADTLSPSQQGILTLQGGSVRSYTDGDVQIYQSRVFTQQGGNVELFSANGDLNAGKGPKSKSAYPPLKLICDTDGYCRVSPAGLVTGAGVGALLSIPGQDPTKSNVVLSAPRGTVDFGAAGVRSANNLAVVALQVLNAFNAQVGGVSVGVPTVSVPNVGALTSASNAAGSAAQQATTPAKQGGNAQPSVIIVEVIGFGGGDSSAPPQQPSDQSRTKKDQQTQDIRSRYQVIGAGALTDEQTEQLKEENRRLTGR